MRFLVTLGAALVATTAFVAIGCSNGEDEPAATGDTATEAAATAPANATATSATNASPTVAATPTTAAAPSTATASANNATIAQIQAALEAAGVPNPAQWAREVEEYRPYPTNDPTMAKLRQNLAKYNPGPGVVDKIVAALSLP